MLHAISDIGLMFTYIWAIAKSIFQAIATPVVFLFNFLYSFFDKFLTGVENIDYEAPINFSTSTVTLLEQLPYWSEIQTVVGAGLMIMIILAIFKILHK